MEMAHIYTDPGDLRYSGATTHPGLYEAIPFFNSGTNLHLMLWGVIFYDAQSWPMKREPFERFLLGQPLSENS